MPNEPPRSDRCWDITPVARAIGAAVCLLGMFWIHAEAAFWASREGFARGWKLRGVLAFRHTTRDKEDDA